MNDRIVWGVAELRCWITHSPQRWPRDDDAERCIDAHLDAGIRHLAWELGRSVLTYHSDLPGATCTGFIRVPRGMGAGDTSAQIRAMERMFRRRCQLRAALRYGHERDCILYGRLCMNRHYSADYPRRRSRFVQDHPQYLEHEKTGHLDVTRLTYAQPAYRQERLAILMEAVQIGCDGLCLDFCRQPPFVRYHPDLIAAYQQQYGVDPRSLDPRADAEAFMRWCRFRAARVTELLRELKARLDPMRDRYGRPLPVQVRVPNDGLEANLLAGLDVETWCRDRLVDELALSELRWLREYDAWSDEPYAALGRRTGVRVFGGVNCLPVQHDGWAFQCNPRGVNPRVWAQYALARYDAGVDGLSVFQTDTGVQLPGLPDIMRRLSNPDALREIVNDPAFEKAHPVRPEHASYGIDNHSMPIDARMSLAEL